MKSYTNKNNKIFLISNIFKTKISVSPFGLRRFIAKFKDYQNKNLIALNELNYNIDNNTVYTQKKNAIQRQSFFSWYLHGTELKGAGVFCHVVTVSS